MLNRLKSLAFLIITIIIQIAFINQGVLFNFYPNLILVYLVFIFHIENKNYSLILAILAGLICDALFSSFFGVKTMGYILVCMTVLFIKNYIYSENLKNSIIFILPTKIIYVLAVELIYFFKLNLFSLSNIVNSIFSFETLIEIFLYYLLSQYYFLSKNKGELY